jgi:hypothetical protein
MEAKMNEQELRDNPELQAEGPTPRRPPSSADAREQGGAE